MPNSTKCDLYIFTSTKPCKCHLKFRLFKTASNALRSTSKYVDPGEVHVIVNAFPPTMIIMVFT